MSTTATRPTTTSAPSASSAPRPDPGDPDVMVGGVVLAAGGALTWGVVQSQLSAENTTVAEDAAFLAGDEVNGPFSAYAQAEIINEHALAGTQGRTYAELDREDRARARIMNASFLRAPLFTSVVSFGVAAMAIGLGVLFTIVYALHEVAPPAAYRG
jgi:hypothetical protein